MSVIPADEGTFQVGSSGTSTVTSQRLTVAAERSSPIPVWSGERRRWWRRRWHGYPSGEKDHFLCGGGGGGNRSRQIMISERRAKKHSETERLRERGEASKN